MIFSDLAYAERIYPLHPGFAQVFDFVKSHDLLSMPLGRIDLDGDKVYILNSLSPARLSEKSMLEIHRKYIDVHILLEGRERVGWLSADELGSPLSPFDESKDIAFFSGKSSSFVDMKSGQFLIVYPEDAHAPLIGEGKIRKAVAKVMLSY